MSVTLCALFLPCPCQAFLLTGLSLGSLENFRVSRHSIIFLIPRRDLIASRGYYFDSVNLFVSNPRYCKLSIIHISACTYCHILCSSTLFSSMYVCSDNSSHSPPFPCIYPLLHQNTCTQCIECNLKQWSYYPSCHSCT